MELKTEFFVSYSSRGNPRNVRRDKPDFIIEGMLYEPVKHTKARFYSKKTGDIILGDIEAVDDFITENTIVRHILMYSYEKSSKEFFESVISST